MVEERNKNVQGLTPQKKEEAQSRHFDAAFMFGSDKLMSSDLEYSFKSLESITCKIAEDGRRH